MLLLITRPQPPAACHPSLLPGPPPPSHPHPAPPHSLRVIRFLSISRLRSLPAHLATKLRTHSWGKGGTERGTWGSWANMRNGGESRTETWKGRTRLMGSGQSSSQNRTLPLHFQREQHWLRPSLPARGIGDRDTKPQAGANLLTPRQKPGCEQMGLAKRKNRPGPGLRRS